MALISTITVVLLPFILTIVHVMAEDSSGLKLRRQKREWIIPPKKLLENKDYTKDPYIAKIRSDKEYESRVIYSLTGIGADQDPVGLFSVEPGTGLVHIHGILDREKKSSYNLFGVARYSNGSRAEKDVELGIIVLDQNDCTPVFTISQSGFINESSATGIIVIRVIATDDDEANTPASQIKYTLEETSNSAGMFYINQKTGEIRVQKTTLDRETKDTYTLTILGSDINGERGGNTGTGQVVIKIQDINDNIPTLEKEYYEGSVEENMVNVEVMRIKAIDLDQAFSDNWLAVYTIVTGNEAGYFSITTDSKTNEGIIMTKKALDYEELKELNLAISVSNKAAYYFGSSSTSVSTGGGIVPGVGKTYPIKINVKNQKEWPKFQPMVKVVTVSENSATVTVNKVITTYSAIDSDTLKTATNVRYAKLKDLDNWLIINEKTAEIRLNKLPDRESKYLVNGTYYAEIIAITTDIPPKTATGTVAIQVEDFNDHCPTLTATSTTMCLGETAVYVDAVDSDSFPNGAPFTFRVIQEDSQQKWNVEHVNGTTAILRDRAHLWPGNYKVVMEITDQQGKACAGVQTLNVVVCTCHEVIKVCLAPLTHTKVTLGTSAILLILLALLLLLLVPLLLLFCLCGGAAAMGDFKAIPFDTIGGLMTYHTEGQGEDKKVPFLQAPVVSGHGDMVGSSRNTDFRAVVGAGGGGGGAGEGQAWYRDQSYQHHGFHQGANMGYQHNGFHQGTTCTDGGAIKGYYGHSFTRHGEDAYDGIALSEGFLGKYYSTNAAHAAQNDHQKDSLLIYDYEGQGSPVGSVGCCSLLGTDDDLEFLNDLGPKFKTLAEICKGSTAMEFKAVNKPVQPPSPRPTTSTHTDFSRDTAHTVNTHNSSTTSTHVQESLVTPGSVNISKVHVQGNVSIPSQTLLIQPPNMYYTAAPMYVVEPHPQLVLVDQRGRGGFVQPVVGHMGVGMGQGMVQLGGIQGSQGMVLVERQVEVGGAGGRHGQVVTEGGEVLQGAGQTITGGSKIIKETRQTISQGAHIPQGGGNFPAGGGFSQGHLSGSRNLLVVESGHGMTSAAGRAGSGDAQVTLQRSQGSSSSLVHESEVKGQNVKRQSVPYLLSEAKNYSATVTTTPTAAPRCSAVVQERNISVTKKYSKTSTTA
ncbi:hypothetical protein UPYG_G00291820 [Umbra pygmaea]|uniref:Cadherin domain-containing protein n=1 Tax=Umbra pygmaea TaxID=75934 RepID=A0ABD0W6H6_UMBPY